MEGLDKGGNKYVNGWGSSSIDGPASRLPTLHTAALKFFIEICLKAIHSLPLPKLKKKKKPSFPTLECQELHQLAQPAAPKPRLLLCLAARSCRILCDPKDCSSPGSSVQGDSPGKNTDLGCHALRLLLLPPKDLCSSPAGLDIHCCLDRRRSDRPPGHSTCCPHHAERLLPACSQGKLLFSLQNPKSRTQGSCSYSPSKTPNPGPKAHAPGSGSVAGPKSTSNCKSPHPRVV